MKVFTENQKFTQPLVLIGLAVAVVAVGYSIYNDWGNISNGKNGEIIGVLSGMFILIFVAFLFLLIKLTTRIDEKGIYYQFFPFYLSPKLVSWHTISTYRFKKYSVISEYGASGLRIVFFRKNGKAFTTKGNMGLQLELKNGKRILIGTQKQDDLRRALDTYKHKITNG